MCHLTGTALFTILLGLTTNFGQVTNAAPVLILFEDSNFRGIRTEFTIDGSETCVNIRGKLNDFFSSVQNAQSNDCFLLCEHEFCRGRCVRVTESIKSLNSVNFNDMASSVKRCPKDVQLDPQAPILTPIMPIQSQPRSESTNESSQIGSGHLQPGPEQSIPLGVVMDNEVEPNFESTSTRTPNETPNGDRTGPESQSGAGV